jgi:RNA polymerase sigma-70 factor (ECF subfamily)
MKQDRCWTAAFVVVVKTNALYDGESAGRNEFVRRNVLISTDGDVAGKLERPDGAPGKKGRQKLLGDDTASISRVRIPGFTPGITRRLFDLKWAAGGHLMSYLDADEPLQILRRGWSVEDSRGAESGEAEADDRPLDYATAGDERLVIALAQRDVKALEAIYDRYGDYVYSVSLRVVGDAQLAEDIAQEVFLRLWRRPDLFDSGRGRFITWLLSVARNRAIDERRSRGRRFRHENPPGSMADDLPAERAEDPAASALHSDDRVVVQKALALLPEDQRIAIQLAYFGGYTQQEIAAGLHQPLGTVKTRIRLGLQKLRAVLIEQRDGR